MKLIPFLVIPVGGLTMFVLGVLMIVDAITTAIRRQRLRRQVRQPICQEAPHHYPRQAYHPVRLNRTFVNVVSSAVVGH
jgi:hypothetical protein